MKRIEKYEQIERYLLGRLNEAEKADFELRLKTDSEFANEVEMHRNLQQLLIDHSLLEIRETLKDIRSRDLLRKLQFKKLYRGLLIVGFCAFILSISLLLLRRKDIAVRPASEAHEASEAFQNIQVRKEIPIVEISDIEPSNNAIKENVSSEQMHPEETGSEPLLFGDERDIIEEIPQKSEPVTGETATESPVGNTYESDTNTNIPCNISAAYSVEPSCKDAATGIIRIDENSVSGGTAPYRAVLNGNSYQSMEFINLQSAGYRLEIIDSEGCITLIANILVDAVNCFPRDTRFSPVYEIWEMPLEPGEPGTIIIYNKEGLMVYRLNFNGNNIETWNGTNLKHESLIQGVYPFVIKYENGSIFQGTVTIVR